ncbi:amino acid/amide ABC transporter ATP-binding protein 2 (HAAT family) [Humitalea rosea]|uniref:Amino acid/amide ABC transporter ATP-binding protein 2 (HAAT family) n=2 Tax=Humitalea rosea TaxID=990373 RepID=A0A2W7JS44_9PROT|nr:ABC transporter ATP-binding protein [Humitalea rosea]PZW37746.1 amino acid/amide ABC transporter ATP-binding protein 2 (HAAT family) [Humitalea rosea]
MAMLEVRDIDLAYGPIRAVTGVSIRVEQGEVVAIVGANGAGKSTLLKSIAGLLPLSGGSIHFEDADISTLPAHRRVGAGIALSPEGRQVFPDQTVRDNLELGAWSRRLNVGDLAAAVEQKYTLFPRLRERQGQMAMTLSGGEQQMLAIARALMGAPRLLLLDEPSLGLAPLVIRDIFLTIRKLRAAGMTVLLVEQMANLALGIADRAYVLETGRVTLSGTGAELLQHPQVRAAYLGH